MPLYKDQLNREIFLPAIPKRIVSLVPSQTELLFNLGLTEEVVGITQFCIHPEQWFRSKARVGGTKNVKAERVKALQPDLIIASKEENVKEQITTLESIAPVWISDINNLDDAAGMMHTIGDMTGTAEKAQDIIHNIRQGFLRLSAQITTRETIPTAYLIWKDPYMAAGGGTFIHDMLQRTGFSNAFESLQRYPQISTAALRERGTALVLLSSEPYPFRQKHITELQLEVPAARVILVDGEMFSWYGSRMLYAAEYLQKLHASLFPANTV